MFCQIPWNSFKELSDSAIIKLLPLSSIFYVNKMSIKVKNPNGIDVESLSHIHPRKLGLIENKNFQLISSKFTLYFIIIKIGILCKVI